MFIVLAREGQSIRIGDRVIRVMAVTRPGLVSVMVVGEPDPVLLSWDRKLELFPGVKVTIERVTNYSQRIKFFFEAPRSVHIRELPYEPPE